MSKHAPWTKEQAEQWAKEWTESTFKKNSAIHSDDAYLAGLAKAAEMINEAPTVYGNTEYKSWGEFQNHEDTHSAKLVGVQRIEGEK